MPFTPYTPAPSPSVESKGAANGIASLDAGAKVPATQLPSYVDDVLEYASTSAFPAEGETGKIYVALDTNKSYRWSGSTYVELSSYAEATQSASGLMSSTDKAKLDGIQSGATAVTVSDSLSDTSTTNALSAAQGKALKDNLDNVAGTGKSWIANADMNTYTTPGIYYLSTGITTGSDSFGLSYVILEVISGRDDTLVQIIHYGAGDGNPSYFTRQYRNNVWSSVIDPVNALNSKLSANCNIFNWGTVTSTIASKIASESASHKGEGNWGARFYFSASSPPSDLPANELKWRYATGEFYARNTDNSAQTDGYLILRAFGTSETIECNVTANALGTWTSLNSKITETIVMDLTAPSTKTSAELSYPSGCSGNNCLVVSTLLYIYGRWYYGADKIFGYTVANSASIIYVDFSGAEDRALGCPYRIVMNKVPT